MGKKTALAGRAWNILRLGVFKRRSLMGDFLRNYIKSLRPTSQNNSIHCGEREFSLDETPMFNFKMQRSAGSMRFRYLPHIPCIKPPLVDFDDDDDDDGGEGGSNRNIEADQKRSFYNLEEEDYEGGGDHGIDSKADEFIARFYKQMKLQRQVSYLQYEEMLQRGTTT